MDDIESKLAEVEKQYKDSQLDKTLPIAAAYVETKDELTPWLKSTKEAVESFNPPAILADELKSQQTEAKVILGSTNEMIQSPEITKFLVV